MLKGRGPENPQRLGTSPIPQAMQPQLPVPDWAVGDHNEHAGDHLQHHEIQSIKASRSVHRGENLSDDLSALQNGSTNTKIRTGITIPSNESVLHEGFGLRPEEHEASATHRREGYRPVVHENPDPDYDM